MDIFRIQYKFTITGRGTVYTLKRDKQANIRIGDMLVDLNGNRFKVKSIEMIRRILDDPSIIDSTVGVMFELIDGVEVEGRILVRNFKNINFLYCNHPLYSHKVDEDYEEEYIEAINNYNCALFSYEDMENGKLSLYGESISGLTIYRGWMMKPDMYKRFYSLLEDKGIILINEPEEYNRYHLLPGWYDDFKNETSDTVWETKGDLQEALNLTKNLNGSYIVKDYVKSRKHEWYDDCFIYNICNKENAAKIIGNFINRQGDNMEGGVVLRKFQNLKQIGIHEQSKMPLSEEYRVFIFAGRIVTFDGYWNEDADNNISNEEMKWVNSIAKKVKSNFVTVDLARKEDGTLIIMEFGDGQVSGLQQINPKDFYPYFDEK